MAPSILETTRNHKEPCLESIEEVNLVEFRKSRKSELGAMNELEN